MSEFAGDIAAMDPEIIKKMTAALLEMATNSQGGITLASSLAGPDTEQLLMDGAIDQTFAFSRS